MSGPYDALLLVSFGGPEGRDDVIPFLENVLRGRDVPPERMLEVAENYYQFDGVSPINDQNRALLAVLEQELEQYGPKLPIYWGNRNWHPMLTDTVQQMADDGVQRALALVTSAFGSFSGCRQYLNDIEESRRRVGQHAPLVDKLRPFFNHPGFIEPVTERVQDALRDIPQERRDKAVIAFTAHSIPCSMAETSPYVDQLSEACRLVSNALGSRPGELVYQSRSGPPQQPWLGPDICDHLRRLRLETNSEDVVVVPLGFLSDHMEVQFDLDVEAAAVCQEIGLQMWRSKTVGTHPRFIRMIRELVNERTSNDSLRLAVGQLPATADQCSPKCCAWKGSP
jgi:ferrochelatase